MAIAAATKHDPCDYNQAVSIADTCMNGPDEKHPRALSLMKAQAAVAEREEFRGNVAFVGTKNFWRPQEVSPSGQGYHWNTNAETYYLIGEGMGEAMKRLLSLAAGNTNPQGIADPLPLLDWMLRNEN